MNCFEHFVLDFTNSFLAQKFCKQTLNLSANWNISTSVLCSRTSSEFSNVISHDQQEPSLWFKTYFPLARKKFALYALKIYITQERMKNL